MANVGLRETAIEGVSQGICACCEEETVISTSSLHFERGGIAFSLAGVPAQVCPSCGEAYIDPRLAKPLWDCATSAIQLIISVKEVA